MGLQFVQAGKLAGVTTAAVAPAPAVMATSQAMPLRGVSPTGPFRSLECRPCRLKGVYTPASTPYESRGRMVVMVDRDRTAENSPLVGSSMDTVDDKQVRSLGLVLF